MCAEEVEGNSYLPSIDRRSRYDVNLARVSIFRMTPICG